MLDYINEFEHLSADGYKLLSEDTIQRLYDNAYIPMDKGNRDYIIYLNWVSEGNTPEPMDEIPDPPEAPATKTIEERVSSLESSLNDISSKIDLLLKK